MQASIISTGNELLLGSTLDTNTNWLCKKLNELNVKVVSCFIIGDDQEKLRWAILEASKQSELIIITGGLGPTDDDITRFVLAKVGQTKLIENKEALSAIEELFRSKNRSMNERNRIQAMIPQTAEIIKNPIGTACGIKMKIGQATIFSLPGVPDEMKLMFNNYIISWISKFNPQNVYRKKIHCVGIAESNLVDRIKEITDNFPHVEIGTTAKDGIITINLSSDNESAIKKMTKEISDVLGREIVFGFDDESLEFIVGKLLKERKEKLTVAESCTGGLISKLITDVPGSSEYFVGGYICYSNELKKKILGVSEKTLSEKGAVSEETAKEMAIGALRISEADWAISTTGIAGPTGGTEEKPVGLVYIAIASKNNKDNADNFVTVNRFLFARSTREIVRKRAAIASLNLLRNVIMEKQK